MTLLFTVAMTRPAYVRGATVSLAVELTNSGDRAVDLPAPGGRCVYSLTPPGTDEALQEEGPAPLVAPDGTTRPIGPGERWQGVVELDQTFPLEADGSYRVSATLQWGDVRLDSTPQEFRFEDLRVDRLTVGYRGGPEGGSAHLLFLRTKDPGKALMTSTASLDKGRDEEPKLGSPYEHRTLSAGAMDPVTTSSRASLQLTWSFWREENTLFGFRSAASSNRTLKLTGSVQRLIEPALLDAGSLTHLYALSDKDGKPTLLVIRVMDYLEAPKDRERILAERTLTAMPDGTAAMIDDVNGKARRALVLARLAGPAPTFDWISYAGDAVPDAPRSHAWSKMITAEKLPDSRPALYGFPEGGLRFAWVVRESGKPKQGILCEVSFDEAGTLKSETTTPLTTESPIKAARIVYLQGLPTVALWTEDGKVLAGQGDALRVVIPKSLGRVPPTLFVLRSNPCVLDFDPAKGMMLVPTR